MADNAPISGTGLSVTNVAAVDRRIFYQLSDGQVEQTDDATGIWISEVTTPTPVFLSPLATVTDQTGRVHKFSLDKDYTVQEYYTDDGGKVWKEGTLHTSSVAVKAVPGSGLAAVVFKNDSGSEEHVVVFCQYESAVGTRAIKRLSSVNRGDWGSDDVDLTNFSKPLAGTALAAVAQKAVDPTKFFQVNLYYQAEDLSINEVYCTYDRSTVWHAGLLEAKGAGKTPLGAVSYNGSEIQVYWRSPCGSIKFTRFHGGVWRRAVAIDGVESGSQFTVSELEDGKKLGLYYQTLGGAIREHLSDNGGDTWFNGARLT